MSPNSVRYSLLYNDISNKTLNFFFIIKLAGFYWLGAHKSLWSKKNPVLHKRN